MVMKKVHILYDMKDTPWGGGNQFFKELRHELQMNERYAEKISDADVIIFSSHHQMDKVIQAKIDYPDKHFVHRMGSVFTYARGDKYLDQLVIEMNQNIADGTIFQSRWQEEKFHEIGLPIGIETIIHNAPNEYLFNSKSKIKEQIHGLEEHELIQEGLQKEKIRLITTGWSTGDIKGFDIYKYLDEHLDFDKYSFIFLGNSKVKFKNITSFPPQISMVVASILQGSDIFITATQNDACSNSLVEALHCGLPVVARNSGGHPELVGKAGVLFDGKEDVLDAIEMVSSNLEMFRERIQVESISKIAQKYYSFCMYILENTVPKHYDKSRITNMKIMQGKQKAAELFRRVIS
ncbi:MAG: glycosyltransferase [Candidatus Ratteibacteria bacterium]|nr:glycosyltransferase [Candidatus Ratteibacteria bacterium]